MKTDKFTKAVLTVIAINLTILTVKNIDLVSKAHADEPVKQEKLTKQINYGLVPLNEDGTISVRVKGLDKIDVNITGIHTSDELDVNIDEIGGGTVWHGGPIPVELDD
ncbi:hypothetical protein EMN47_10100 [Prolixibacteraceae bacterium JC049]|nr:hypothetical protein [Prolixibacteraceae bacterium JC049]